MTLLVMEPEVFEGGNGDLVICQEWPSLGGERYVRIIVPMNDVPMLFHKIMRVCEAAGRGR